MVEIHTLLAAASGTVLSAPSITQTDQSRDLLLPPHVHTSLSFHLHPRFLLRQKPAQVSIGICSDCFQVRLDDLIPVAVVGSDRR